MIGVASLHRQFYLDWTAVAGWLGCASERSGRARGGRRCDSSDGNAFVCSGKILTVNGCRPFAKRSKNSFIWFAGLVTWELETRVLGHGWDKALDGGHNGICTLGVD